MKRRAGEGRAGFTLIELAVLLVVVGLLILLAVLAVPLLTERERLDVTRVTLDEVGAALISFAAIHSRLPCPDVDGDGLEGTAGGCAPGHEVGTVPYRDLGLADPVLDEAHLPVRYAVYRNEPAGADLAALPNRFIPVVSGDPPTLTTYPTTPGASDLETPTEGINPDGVEPDNRNDLDFCLALRRGKQAAAVTEFVHTLDSGGAPGAFFNSAFVLASGGVEDADGDAADGSFDGANVGPDESFDSPARRRSDAPDPALAYDDVVYAMPFGRLESQLSCAAGTIAVTSAGNVAIAAAHGLVWGEDALWSARLGRESALIAQIMADVALVTATITLVIAGLDLAILIAGCITPDDDCVGVGFAVAAVVLAAIAEGLAIAAVVITAIALAAADTALAAAEATVPGLYDHAIKTRDDALAADALGGQW